MVIPKEWLEMNMLKYEDEEFEGVQGSVKYHTKESTTLMPLVKVSLK